MNTTKWIRNLWVVSAVGQAVWAPSAEALENNGGYTISDVTARQRWPWSRKVDIDFTLAKPEGASSSQGVSISLVASNGADVVTLSEASLSGDRDFVLPDGTRRIVWDPTVDHAGQAFSQAKFYLKVTATNVEPTYLVVDLSSGRAEYKAASFSNAVNADVYKTDKLALRLLPAGTFIMGEGTTTQLVTLTKNFYAGVFEVSEAQWTKIMGGTNTSANAKGFVSYNAVRGPSPINWYTTGSSVSSTNFIGLLRARTGLQTFDLPTESQWEYLCRAGTTTYYNDGLPGTADSQASVIGWWSGNSGPAVHPGGQKQANRWGLYDVPGNVNEWCLDWYGANISGGSDPAGPSTGSNRVRRGGNWNAAALYCRSAGRLSSAPDIVAEQNGFRIVLNLP